MVITGSPVAVRCWRRPLAWPRTPTVFGPLACRPSARAGPPRRRRPPAWRAEPERPDDAGRVAPRAQGPTPAPTQPTGLARAFEGGPAALGPRYPRPGEAARICDACRGLIPLDFSEILGILTYLDIDTRPRPVHARQWRVARDGQLTLGYGGPAVRKLA